MVMVMLMIAYRVKSAELNRCPWRLGNCALISLARPATSARTGTEVALPEHQPTLLEYESQEG
jgi:hypothetical protein